MSKRRMIAWIVLVLLGTSAGTALALSRELHAPEVFWRKGFDEKTSNAVMAVFTDARFKFKQGLISYWEPKFETMLAYDGDTASLNAFVAALSKVNGIN